MKIKGSSALLFLSFLIIFFSCTKINESTQIGDDLIPGVDNVNTFDTTLDVFAAYHPYVDSNRHFLSENMALGKLLDPVFGTTTADMFFNLSSQVYNVSPFSNKDSVIKIDSVVLSMAYQGGYGDTSAATTLTVQVSEIAKSSSFTDTTLYRFDTPPPPTTGPVLGTKSFTLRSLSDSQVLIRKRDTSRVTNVLRIRLDTSIGVKLKSFDTTAGAPYKSDSLFRDAFRGLAVKTTSVSGPGALGYFNLVNTNTRLIVYYQVRKNGVIDTTSASFVHLTYSQINSVIRNPGGNYLASLNQQNPQQLYIQSSPSGSYVGMKIPGLDQFPNKIIHRAELITYKVPSTLDNIFTPPPRLFLDRKAPNADSAYLFENDIQPGFDGSLNFDAFGGVLRTDNAYRFNVTRFVQGIVTRRERNDSLRLYAPLRSTVYAKNLAQFITVPVLGNIARGRVVLSGPTHPDPGKRLRLRIIYSNL